MSSAQRHMSRALIPLLLAATTLQAQTTGRSTDWPVYGGSEDHTHYTTLGQISPANVKQLKAETHFNLWTHHKKQRMLLKHLRKC